MGKLFKVHQLLYLVKSVATDLLVQRFGTHSPSARLLSFVLILSLISSVFMISCCPESGQRDVEKVH